MTIEKHIENLKKLKSFHNGSYGESINAAVKALEEPKTGHWIDDVRLGYHVSVCSNCNWRGHGDNCLIYKPKYCPNCGARMVEPQERSDKG